MQERLQLFGVACWCDGQRSVDLPDALPGYLLAYLALRADWVGRDALVGLFWPERSDRDALHNLRANLHRVRTLLAACGAADALQAEPRRVRLALPTDVAAFRLAVGGGDWPRAVELHAAPLLAQWSYRGFPLAAEWARVERAALAGAWRDAALKAAQQHELSGHAAAAAQALLRLLQAADEPTEDAVQALLRVAVDAGQRDAALAAYERLQRWLHDELGVEPMRQTAALAHALRQPGSTAPATTAPRAAAVPRAVLHPPRLVGRAAERASLADARTPIVAIAGEPGVGKTRLLEEALPRATWIACREGLEQVPCAPLVEWLDDQRDSLPDPGAHRLDLARLVPALAHGEQPPPADAATARPRLLLALCHLLEARGNPLVFDDLQWADSGTRELIVLLARRAALPLRLSYRSNELHDELQALLDALDAGADLARIELHALPAADLLELLGSVSGSRPALFNTWLHRHTGGNPFFVLQTLRSLFESGRLVAAGDGWASALDDITHDYSELQVPPRVADLIRRRVRGLSESARRVLMVLAVAGDARAVDPVAACAGLSAWATAEAIAELQAAGLLREHRFAHDLVRQSLYDAAPPPLRTVLHAAVARHFTGVLHDAQIAHHWWLAGDAAQALDAIARATAAQRRAGLHGDALALADDALRRVTDSAARARLLALRARIRLERSEAADAERDADAVLDEAADPHDRAEACIVIAALRMQQGRIDEARQQLERAAAADPDHDALCIERARVAQLQGRVADAVAELEQRCARLRRLPPGSELVQALTSLGAAHDEAGQVERGLALHQEAYRLAARLNACYAQVEAAINLLWTLTTLDRHAEAIEIAEEALALGEYDSTPTLRNNLVYALRELGRLDEAMALCEQLATGSDPTLALIAQARLIDLQARQGQVDGALAPRIEALLDRIDSTDAYHAHVTAAKMVLLHGSADQVGRVLPYLEPQPLDPWLHGELSRALAARGIDPLPYIGAPSP
jgi:DNA-binding SARP family transcriptional activator